MTLFEDLSARGLISDTTHDTLPARLAEKPITLYCGFDPTADSLHVGSLVPLLALRRFQLAGHHPIAVAGGATGSIGDPSGKTQERQLLTTEQIQANVNAVRPQLAKLLDFETKVNPARLVDNADWFRPITFIDFLRDVGKHFTVNQMVAKESVRARMEDRDVGISYTEFSYMLLQAYDFYHLADRMNCELQIGGSDQWGNITAGIDLVRKKIGKPSYGLTMPLITKSDGTKFGKTESGTIWLDAARTSVYKFYQFWINTDDRDVIRYLNYFTLLPHKQIAELVKSHTEKPEARVAHQALAKEITSLIHGAEAVQTAQRASEILFGGSLEGISEATLQALLAEVPGTVLTPEHISGEGHGLLDAMVACGLTASKGAARKDVEGGGVQLNGQRVTNVQQKLTRESFLLGKYAVLRKGKRNYAIATIG
jgi:tyrosyl-tRNA synthetase